MSIAVRLRLTLADAGNSGMPGGQMVFMQKLAHAGKIAQGCIVTQKN